MLILFDIDGTLLLTHGEGMRAMQDAGRELCHPEFTIDGADYSGRLDPLIWKQLCEINRVEENDELHIQFRAAYRRHLQRRFDNGATATVLPGVARLVEELTASDNVTLGLVTGNYPETGQLKIETAGLDFSVFGAFGWGCDGNHRRDLPRVAIERHEKATRRSVGRGNVIVVGDTPHDIDCARYNRCRSLAVATGAFDPDTLAAAGADHVVPDLSQTDEVIRWLMKPRLRSAERR